MKLSRPTLAAAAVFILFTSYAVVTRYVLPERVVVTTPTRGPAIQAVYATGTVEPTVMLPIASRTSARIMSIHADEGASVRKGQTLAQLEDTDLVGTVEEWEARVTFLSSEFSRIEALAKRKLVSPQELDRARSEREAAVASLKRARAQAEFMKLVAPEDGTIIRRDGEVGELLSANEPLFWLSCCAPLRVTAEVDEEDIPLVSIGQRAVVAVDALPGAVFPARVVSITPKGDSVARSYRVRLAFEGQTTLLIGMTTEVNITVREVTEALLVPSGAVVQNDILVVEDGTIRKRSVQIGARGAQVTEIREGLADSDVVVVEPDQAPPPGTTVSTQHIQGEQAP